MEVAEDSVYMCGVPSRIRPLVAQALAFVIIGEAWVG